MIDISHQACLYRASSVLELICVSHFLRLYGGSFGQEGVDGDPDPT